MFSLEHAVHPLRYNDAWLCTLAQVNAMLLYCCCPNYSLAAGVGGAFEVTGPAGTSLEGWSIQLYNGNEGSVCEYVVLLQCTAQH